MHIKNIFEKELFRPINGVVKADQHDREIVWQELDEFVVTKELLRHFNKFFKSYLDAVDNPRDPVVTSRMAVWISGFFGSGKSHFLKILSYLLDNRLAVNVLSNEERRAVEFFEEKLGDPFLLGEVKRAVGTDTDVIIFNVDSKAANKDSRDAILEVFLRVFNEMQGYSGDVPYLAQMERYLDSKGQYAAFKTAFAELAGAPWETERDAFLMMRDEVITALATALQTSEDAAAKWFDGADKTFNLNIEGFAKLVKEYLDSKGPQHRIAFMVDEIGQFIGSDTHLMLNLQTIVEDLGRVCNGRAWVLVTSQEDIDAVLGEVRGSKANDFSKIQGRFYSRLSLSSSNTDEVIQARLLEKKGDARRALEELWEIKGDILKNQLSFVGGATLKGFTDADCFQANYPFAPYHFQLVQKVFESIRKAGATGTHLSRGERSMLDAFQSAAKNIAHKEVGALVPLYEFYPAIESYLDTIVKKTIEQADGNSGLEPFDTQLLRVLFLIRYVDIVKATVDNLVTLCITQVDADRLQLKRSIECSLARLEKESLINSNGDLYFFLTNEERDVPREIKKVEIAGNEQVAGLRTIIFEDVLKDDNKVRYPVNKRDYGYNRLCDGQISGARADNELTLEILSPLNDEYPTFNPAHCIMRSTNNNGCTVIKLEENRRFFDELQMYLQTDKYIKQKSDAAAADTLKKILKERAEQNRERKGRLLLQLEGLLLEGDYYVCGQTLPIKANNPRGAVNEGMLYLVENLFTKLGFLKVIQDEPLKEITALLKSNDIGQQSLQVEAGDANKQALDELRGYIDLATSMNQSLKLDSLVAKFARRPYGWPEWEVVLLVARLFMTGDLNLMQDSDALPPKDAIDPLTKSAKWKQITILKRKTVGDAELKSARTLGQELFHLIGPDSEEQLNAFLRRSLQEWLDRVREYKPYAREFACPGYQVMVAGEKLILKLTGVNDSFEFFTAFIGAKDDLLDLAEDMQELIGFYTTQKLTWDKLRTCLNGIFKPNRQELEKNPGAKQALRRMDEIQMSPRPYGMIKEVDGLIATVSAANIACLAKERDVLLIRLEEKISGVAESLESFQATADVRNQALKPLQDIKKQVQHEQSIPNMHYQLNQADEAVDSALEVLEKRRNRPRVRKMGRRRQNRSRSYPPPAGATWRPRRR